MTDALHPLAADFDAPDEAAWTALAEKALNGAPWSRLVGRTADGVEIKPLYRAPDLGDDEGAAGLPGQAPFARGPAAVRDAYLPWDIRQAFDRTDARALNAEILADLARGVSSTELAAPSGVDLAVALEGVLLDLAPVALDNADVSDARALAALLPAEARAAFNLDPASAWLNHGGLDAAFEERLAAAAGFAAETRLRLPHAAALCADGRPAHEAGGSEAQELALMLASGVAHLRALEAAGLDAEAGARTILFKLAVGADVIVEIAKLRAARMLWARVMEAVGAAPEARGMRLHAITSRRMMTRYDAWTNILRTSAAGFAAGAGGADVVTVRPLTELLGHAGPQARRIARNTQIILQEESGLGRVADPAGGAWSVERLTLDLAEKAWTVFQAIEAGGGLAETLRAGWLQAAVAETAAARAADIAARRMSVTGLTDFPALNETTPAFDPRAPIAPPPAGVDVIQPLAWITFGAPFEALRDKARAKAPRAFLATLGPLAEFSPRANFAANLLAAGGIASLGGDAVHPDLEALAAAFKASGAEVAVLCGTDARYAEEAIPAVRALKAAGAHWVALAGKPGGAEPAQRAAGVDQYVFAGQDALLALETLHAALGV